MHISVLEIRSCSAGTPAERSQPTCISRQRASSAPSNRSSAETPERQIIPAAEPRVESTQLTDKDLSVSLSEVPHPLGEHHSRDGKRCSARNMPWSSVKKVEASGEKPCGAPLLGGQGAACDLSRSDSSSSHACGSCCAEQCASSSVLMVIVSGCSPCLAISSTSSMPRAGWQQPHTSQRHSPEAALQRQRDTALMSVLKTTSFASITPSRMASSASCCACATMLRSQ
mmetsp:Transcript_36124/g.84389  ORF Transcript_36124/g.84389 Transcript_36124/m.84389 type:complete len:228 (+) Transcript_36124:193-876(+)